MAATTTLVTVQEFLDRPESEGCFEELIGGEVISTPRAGYPHEITKSNLIRVLTAWSLQNPSTRIFVEAAYEIDDRDCLIPDLSLDGRRVVPGSTGVFQGAPELAIEVVSSESAARLERKMRLYLAHGSKSAWAVFPQERVVRIQHGSGESKSFFGDEPLADLIVLPGFSVPTSAIFEGV
jgi:Uma2 family endonuclease